MQALKRLDNWFTEKISGPDPYMAYAADVERLWPRVRPTVLRWLWAIIPVGALFVILMAVPSSWIPWWIEWPVMIAAMGSAFAGLGWLIGVASSEQRDIHAAIYERGKHDAQSSTTGQK